MVLSFKEILKIKKKINSFGPSIESYRFLIDMNKLGLIH